MSNKKVLIFCFSFPPYPGTGGRRWAKFAKYLAHVGYEVFVISAKNYSVKDSDWKKDVKGKGISVFDLHSFYPQASNKLPNRIFHFLFSKPIQWFTNRNYLDPSIYWARSAVRLAGELIRKEGIMNVIATAPPFGYLTSVADLKNVYPQINLILDVRDSHSYTLKALSDKVRSTELNAGSIATSGFNSIITVADEMSDEYIKLSRNGQGVVTIHNGFDRADFDLPEFPVSEPNPEKIRFIYAGNLIEECSPYALAFFKILLEFREHKSSLYDKIVVDIFGNREPTLQDFCTSNDLKNVHFHGRVIHAQIIKEIACSDFCLIFPADFYYKFSLETKFFEYCYMRKPIVTFPESGICSDLVNSNKLGIALPLTGSAGRMESFLDDYISRKFVYNTAFDIDKYNVRHLTEQLTVLLK